MGALEMVGAVVRAGRAMKPYGSCSGGFFVPRSEDRAPKLLEENTPAHLNFYLNDLRLSQRTAKQLQRELVELIKRHKASRKGDAYTLSVVMAPRPNRR
jgi:hypothetical protein